MSAEIIAKLGLDDEKFERGLAKSESSFKSFVRRITGNRPASGAGAAIPLLPSEKEVERRAGGIMAVLQRKFGSTDAFKDTLRSFGIGGIGAVAAQIGNFFSRASEKA